MQLSAWLPKFIVAASLPMAMCFGYYSLHRSPDDSIAVGILAAVMLLCFLLGLAMTVSCIGNLKKRTLLFLGLFVCSVSGSLLLWIWR